MLRAGGRGTALYPYFQSTVRERKTTVRRENSSVDARRDGNAQRLLRQGIADFFKQMDGEKRRNAGKCRFPIDQNAPDPTTNLQSLRKTKNRESRTLRRRGALRIRNAPRTKRGLGTRTRISFSSGEREMPPPKRNEENQCRFSPVIYRAKPAGARTTKRPASL